MTMTVLDEDGKETRRVLVTGATDQLPDRERGVLEQRPDVLQKTIAVDVVAGRALEVGDPLGEPIVDHHHHQLANVLRHTARERGWKRTVFTPGCERDPDRVVVAFAVHVVGREV